MTEPLTIPAAIDPDAPVYNARLVRREDETESLSYFWVRFDGEPTPFEPGQYMTIGVMAGGKILQRPYSVASPPAEAGTEGYEFYVRRVQGGTFTPVLFDLPVGHRMRMIGPKGKFTLLPDDDRTHIFISSGTGNAPFIAMMKQLLRDGRPRKAILLNGVSYVDEIGYRALMEDWTASGVYPVTFVPTVSRPNDPRNAAWTGRTGRVETIVGPVLDELGLSPANSIAYICGNPDMIVAAEETLLGRGYPEDQVHKELYWPKGKEPRGAAATDLAAAIEAAEANADQ
jgi:ferredoxin/flavodoxin---NADP+ reductase